VPIQSYRDLLVWQKSLRLAKDVERLASRLPVQQRYELASQLRRASSSIPFNIAEGSARPTKVYINHLLIALGSEAELQTELLHAANFNGVSQSEIEDLLARASEIGRMLRGLVRSLRAHLARHER
jgi:four helix bundle protein